MTAGSAIGYDRSVVLDGVVAVPCNQMCIRDSCLSGSFWYEGWLEFLQKQRLAAKGRVYLSLGKKEEQNGPAPLRRVGACTRDTASLLQQQLGEDAVTVEWNPGGHFTDVSGRWRKALTWLTLR